jgi:hypothetical protein
MVTKIWSPYLDNIKKFYYIFGTGFRFLLDYDLGGHIQVLVGKKINH